MNVGTLRSSKIPGNMSTTPKELTSVPLLFARVSMTVILGIKFRQQNFSDKDIDIINFVRRFQILSAAF